MQFKNLLLLFTLGIILIGFNPVNAQSKKALREENTLLQTQVQTLQRQTQTLSVENRNLQQKNQLISKAVDRLRQDSSAMAMEYKLLSDDFVALQNSSTANTSGGNKNGSSNAFAVGGTSAPDPNDSRPCARKQSQLSAGYSYFINTLGKLNSDGWGVQVYSFDNLCTAVERAEEFSSYYRMYKTYIRVKQVNGQTRYSVVYGSLRDEAQARTYCENFRKIAKDEEGRNAFIVQH